MFSPIKINKKIENIRNKEYKESNKSIWFENVIKQIESNRIITQKLENSSNEVSNTFIFDKLDVNKIFHINHIKNICCDYRLRFLDTKYFKGDYPEEAIEIIANLEEEHKLKIEGFQIIAPSILFKLKKADDPLLFAPIGNNYYYLIHKWGNDVSAFRKIKYWPFKNLTNFGTSLLVLSFLLTVFLQFLFYTTFNLVYFIILFLFMIKGVVGFALMLGISSGKKFSEFGWRSKYDKIS